MSELLVTILLALLTGMIAFFAALVTRGNLISGFRQNWINDQRNDLATVAAKATILSSNQFESWSREMEAFAAAFARIRLRENPEEAEWTEVIDEITLLHEDLWNRKNSQHDVTARLQTIDKWARPQLKANWTKTQRGEDGYRRGIMGACIALGIVLAVLIGALVYTTIAGEDDNKDNKGPMCEASWPGCNYGSMATPVHLPAQGLPPGGLPGLQPKAAAPVAGQAKAAKP